MIDLKFSEILQRNKAIDMGNSAEYKVGLLSNIIVTQIQPILELNLKEIGLNAAVSIGDYDNIMQDSSNFKDRNAVLIIWELSNLIDGFQYRSNLLDKQQVSEFIVRFKAEIDYTFNQLKDTPLVILNKFSTLAFNHLSLSPNNFDYICEALNSYVQSKLLPNIVVVDLEKVISRLSIEKSFNFRDFYSSKALYSVEFLKNLVSFITPIFASINGKRKKALIFDCDNTLWEGILGEDGLDGIKMSGASPKGAVYEEVQYLAKELAGKGILIGLNSKNNPEDVDEVFATHPDISLTSSDVIIKKVNWDEKAKNLKQIANELNIGIDSLVFVDDSDFEINLVNQYQPQIETIQVPKERYLYPSKIRERLGLFYSHNNTLEDKNRILMYQQQRSREEEKETFDNIDTYLESLGLNLVLHLDSEEFAPRVAQLSQKTNQFNLTTKRYSEIEINGFIKSDEYRVFCFSVGDKYGDYGLTGVAVIKLNGSVAHIDTFLMSCRVLGRNIEYKFFDEIAEQLSKSGIKTLSGEYIKTLKNQQVQDFYDKLGFASENSGDGNKVYTIDLNNYNFHQLTYINSNYA